MFHTITSPVVCVCVKGKEGEERRGVGRCRWVDECVMRKRKVCVGKRRGIAEEEGGVYISHLMGLPEKRPPAMTAGCCGWKARHRTQL